MQHALHLNAESWLAGGRAPLRRHGLLCASWEWAPQAWQRCAAPLQAGRRQYTAVQRYSQRQVQAQACCSRVTHMLLAHGAPDRVEVPPRKPQPGSAAIHPPASAPGRGAGEDVAILSCGLPALDGCCTTGGGGGAMLADMPGGMCMPGGCAPCINPCTWPGGGLGSDGG
jgi:hypothetical protein